MHCGIPARGTGRRREAPGEPAVHEGWRLRALRILRPLDGGCSRFDQAGGPLVLRDLYIRPDRPDSRSFSSSSLDPSYLIGRRIPTHGVLQRIGELRG